MCHASVLLPLDWGKMTTGKLFGKNDPWITSFNGLTIAPHNPNPESQGLVAAAVELPLVRTAGLNVDNEDIDDKNPSFKDDPSFVPEIPVFWGSLKRCTVGTKLTAAATAAAALSSGPAVLAGGQLGRSHNKGMAGVNQTTVTQCYTRRLWWRIIALALIRFPWLNPGGCARSDAFTLRGCN
ncbi:hypothetical protein PoB_000352400 [Plakobranchus ocellatus]|uniref:Uncharacterized protein n=1 Tax=Plakobranchus ocellatus TaxID=259542 RepID=A0AAV3Y4M0_9GAST|nr:hypothetical protein PoB_000352400 [Plakobranchus ocellatus]